MVHYQKVIEISGQVLSNNQDEFKEGKILLFGDLKILKFIFNLVNFQAPKRWSCNS
jgi:hypothetical protein